MEVILLEKVQNLGNLGDLVRVKPGYARNYLVPQGIATPATAENKAAFEKRRRELEKTAGERLQEAQARAVAMTGAGVEIARKASEEGKLFGSVSTIDIADAMNASGHDLAKSEIHLSEGPLKELGEHEVAVSLHPEVHLTITVRVVAEE
jgi:large subunit ribosomal protein L9